MTSYSKWGGFPYDRSWGRYCVAYDPIVFFDCVGGDIWESYVVFPSEASGG